MLGNYQSKRYTLHRHGGTNILRLRKVICYLGEVKRYI